MNCILSQLQLHALQIMFPDEFSRPSHNNQPITYINLGFRLTTESPGSVEPGDFHICQRSGNVSAHTPNGCQERGAAPCKGRCSYAMAWSTSAHRSRVVRSVSQVMMVVSKEAF